MLDYSEISWACNLVLASGVLWLSIAYNAAIGQGKPLSSLGLRNGIRSSYDPLLGAMSPQLRFRAHFATLLLLWGLFYTLWPLLGFPPDDTDSDTIPLSLLLSGFVVTLTYLYSLFVLVPLLPGVSHPGGPRHHKIQRQPQWPHTPHQPFQSNLRYASAQESHTISQKLFPKAQLTGEPTGRDIWYEATDNHKTDNNTAAWGGREPVFCPAENPNSCDAILRAQLLTTQPHTQAAATNIADAIHHGGHFYSRLQTTDGHWTGDYGGPHFLLPGFVIIGYIMQSSWMTPEIKRGMIHYIRVHQQVDGGWGTHIESPSTMFGTTLLYVALRCLGVPPDDATCQRGRQFIRDHGGALYTSSWAKFYLCLLGCMDWAGHNSIPAEAFLLPNWTPFHPGRMWCHARMVYLPMAYLYGRRFVYADAATDPLIAALRSELYTQDYESIDWIQTRHWVADVDNYSPIGWFMRIAQNVLARYESWTLFQPLKDQLRTPALQFCHEYLQAEDLQTNFICIGPVNKALNMLCAHARGDVQSVRNHECRVADYLWVAEDGVKMKGYNGSQCWDTSFAIQAYYECQLLDDFPEVARRAWSFLERTQILSTPVSQATEAHRYEEAGYRMEFYRHLSKGGWPFSTSAHGWPISDCTGEGLKGVLCLRDSSAVQKGLADKSLLPIDRERLENACDVLLTYQNEDGGFATYENNRGFFFYEWLNPSEVFGDIMIDYSYVECSMASLTALVEFSRAVEGYKPDEIQEAVRRGRNFLKSLQRPDGSWYGSWACCFCYGGWFGVEGLIKCGEPKDSKSIVSACEFLIKHQRANGGWGEDFTSCYDKDYAANGMEAYGDDGSGVVNTAWALLALSAAESPDVEAVRRGVQYLIKRQLPGGDWPQEGVAGVFNRACGITYTAYRNVFPLWALGRCRKVYGEEALDKQQSNK